MKDDYLWDRSGKPDPEIQQLEDILGDLKYQLRALEIPARKQTSRSRFFFRGLAVAAAVALMVLGLGLWLGMQRRQGVEFSQTESKPAEKESSTAAVSTVDEKKLSGLLASNGTEQKPSQKRSSTRHINRRSRPAAGTLDPNELAEAEAAKEKLMLALRLASSKLNVAQKRMQGAGSDNSVQNQHKIG